MKYRYVLSMIFESAEYRFYIYKNQIASLTMKVHSHLSITLSNVIQFVGMISLTQGFFTLKILWLLWLYPERAVAQW